MGPLEGVISSHTTHGASVKLTPSHFYVIYTMHSVYRVNYIAFSTFEIDNYKKNFSSTYTT